VCDGRSLTAPFLISQRVARVAALARRALRTCSRWTWRSTLSTTSSAALKGSGPLGGASAGSCG
jgi:hypothetical protein